MNYYPIWFIALISVLFLASAESRAQSKRRSNPRDDVQLKVVYDQAYGTLDPKLQSVDIYRPANSEILPAIVMIHGGAWIAGDKLNDSMHARQFARAGFVVMAVNYRLAPKHKHPAQIDDCWSAMRWLVEHKDEYGVDAERMSTWGYSAGGHLSALMACDPRPGFPRLKACVAGGAPCDFRTIPDDNRMLVPFLGATRAQSPQLYVDASPIHYVTSDDPPTFLFHGSTDWLVPPRSSEAMHEALDEAKVENERLIVEGKAHIMTFVDSVSREKSIEFLKKHLAR